MILFSLGIKRQTEILFCVDLPISKSVANRLLILQATHGDRLLSVSAANIPDDVRLLHDVLAADKAGYTNGQVIDLANCGTAMRFLTAYFACQEDCDVVLTGCERMKQRPIGQEVAALRTLGADIEYMDKEGYPPLRIKGKRLDRKAIYIDNPQSTQFVSALLLVGFAVSTNIASPYIEMTHTLIKQWDNTFAEKGEELKAEADWSSAAFWYEYIALHGGALCLPGLRPNSLQGDKAVADLFARLGVTTEYGTDGIVIRRDTHCVYPERMVCDFTQIPDLYPAIAITCERLGIALEASGTESLRIKESNRLVAVAEKRVCADHRIAMALLAGDFPCDDVACIGKSYPNFYEQLCAYKRLFHDEV